MPSIDHPTTSRKPAESYEGPERRRDIFNDVPLPGGGRRVTIDLSRGAVGRLQSIMQRDNITARGAVDAALEAYAAEDPDTGMAPL